MQSCNVCVFSGGPVRPISCWTSVLPLRLNFFFPEAPVSPLCPKNTHSQVVLSVETLQCVAQMDALRSCSGEGCCYGDPLPGGCFFFSWVAVGSQRQGSCVNSEKGGGEFVFPMVRVYEKWKKKKKRRDSSSGPQFLKIFIFPYKPSGEVWESEGRGRRRRRNRNSGLVRWGLLDRNVLCQDSLCLGFTRPDHKLNWPSWRWSYICIFPNQGFKPDVASAWQSRSFVIRGRAVSLSDLRKDLCCWCAVTLTIQQSLYSDQ